MRNSARLVAPVAAISLLTLLCGCQATGYRLLNLIGLSEKPLVVMHVIEQPLEPREPAAFLNWNTPYDDFRKELGRRVRRHVVPELCFGFQLQPSLELGTCHLAMISPAWYAELASPERFDVLAVSLDKAGRIERPAVLVVKKDSPIESPDDLRKKVVAFGPSGATRTHLAAVATLKQAGIAPGDLSLEVLPVPGSLKHFPNPKGVLQSVMNDSSDAGFVDLADWEKLPESSDDPDQPARSRLRIALRTPPLPDRLVVAAPKLTPQLREEIAAFLTAIQSEEPEILAETALSGFVPPDSAQLAAWVDALKGAPEPTPAPDPTAEPAQAGKSKPSTSDE